MGFLGFGSGATALAPPSKENVGSSKHLSDVPGTGLASSGAAALLPLTWSFSCPCGGGGGW